MVSFTGGAHFHLFWPLASSAHGKQQLQQPVPLVLELWSAVAVRWVIIMVEGLTLGRRESRGREGFGGEESRFSAACAEPGAAGEAKGSPCR